MVLAAVADVLDLGDEMVAVVPVVDYWAAHHLSAHDLGMDLSEDLQEYAYLAMVDAVAGISVAFLDYLVVHLEMLNEKKTAAERKEGVVLAVTRRSRWKTSVEPGEVVAALEFHAVSLVAVDEFDLIEEHLEELDSGYIVGLRSLHHNHQALALPLEFLS